MKMLAGIILSVLLLQKKKKYFDCRESKMLQRKKSPPKSSALSSLCATPTLTVCPGNLQGHRHRDKSNGKHSQPAIAQEYRRGEMY